MKFKIHRGSKPHGGSCVEVWTDNTRILVDFGMPAVNKEHTIFDFAKYWGKEVPELITQGVLPDVEGLYSPSDVRLDGVLISHPHQDHYGLSKFINKNIKLYMGIATHRLIDLSNLFAAQSFAVTNTYHFERERPFQIGDFTITPYWADHAAFDPYSFLIEADGKRLFYSGDFRSHRKKKNEFTWFINTVPQNVDYLILAGKPTSKDVKPFKPESEIENELVKIFKQEGGINLVYTSGQNLDRIVTIYRACMKTNKIMVVDIYVATLLRELSVFANIPFPSKKFERLKVMYPHVTTAKLAKGGNEKILYQYQAFKIAKSEIEEQLEDVVLLVRPAMQIDLDRVPEVSGGNLIYSMWEGYLHKPNTKEFVDYLIQKQFTLYKLHTRGNVDTETLKQMVETLQPKHIVTLQTTGEDAYGKIFPDPVVALGNGEVREVE